MLSQVENALGMMRVYLVERTSQDGWGDEQATEIAKTIVVCLRKAFDQNRDKPASAPRLSHETLKRTVLFVNTNLDSRLRWVEIARAVGLDSFRFGREFKLATGMTPHQYITRCRLRKAITLLAHGNLPIADVALEVGCSCQSHLTTLFRKYLGTTPGAFRASSRSSAGGTY